MSNRPPRRPAEYEPHADRVYAAFALIVLGATSAITTTSLVLWDPLALMEPPQKAVYDDTPERIARILMAQPDEAETELTEAADRFVQIQPASELLEAKRHDALVTSKPQGALKQSARDKQVAESAGTLGAILDSTEAMSSGGLGGLIGHDGIASTSGLSVQSLSLRGSGLGGGGTASGIGGIGTRGVGGGVSGYGAGVGYGGSASGRGSYGAKGGGTLGPARPAIVKKEARRDVAHQQRVTGPVFSSDPAAESSPDPLGTEDFTDWGINDMELASQDRWSTFAVDVDTASWAITRRKMRDGALPPHGAVRVEEFVNAFQYRYVHTTTDAPFAVNMAAAPHPLEPHHTVLRVGVQGKTLAEDERPPSRLTFLVDVSGSMRGPDRIDLAKESLHWLVDHLGPEDSVALVTYAGHTEVVLEPTGAWQRPTIHAAIDSLGVGGGTNMGEGMALAYDLAERAYVAGAENRVFVLSDGDANIGQTTHEQMLKRIRTHAEGGITLSTVGYGSGNYNDTMMEQLADKGDGNYSYVDGLPEAKRLFGERLAATVMTIARDVKLQVTFDEDAVVAWRLIGYENRDVADKDFRNDAVDGGEIGSGHQVTAVYDVVLRDNLAADQPVATVSVRAKPPGPDRAAKEWNTRFPAGLVRHGWQAASTDLRAAWTLAQLAEKLRGSPHAAELTWDRLLVEALEVQDQGFDRSDEIVDAVKQAQRLSDGRVAAR
jgi:Ca-activated chloride channel homolog